MPHELSPDAALVVFSGGQDSTTCLAWALSRFSRVETVGFRYGQTHAVEMDVRQELRQRIAALSSIWADRLGEDHVYHADVIAQISQAPLTGGAERQFRDAGLPDSFVPGRNLAFMVLAATLAYRRGLKHLITGVCETDFSGYPDCRDDTMKVLQAAINLGTDARFVIHTPLMWIDKKQTWEMAEALGGESLVEIIRSGTHTCYRGERSTEHAWGFGCGTCDACRLRCIGWQDYAYRDLAEKASYDSK